MVPIHIRTLDLNVFQVVDVPVLDLGTVVNAMCFGPDPFSNAGDRATPRVGLGSLPRRTLRADVRALFEGSALVPGEGRAEKRSRGRSAEKRPRVSEIRAESRDIFEGLPWVWRCLFLCLARVRYNPLPSPRHRVDESGVEETDGLVRCGLFCATHLGQFAVEALYLAVVLWPVNWAWAKVGVRDGEQRRLVIHMKFSGDLFQ